MNDDDKKLSAYIAACCLIGALAIVLVSAIVRNASAAALIQVNGAPVIIMTPDEFKEAIERGRVDLRLEVERIKRGCPET